MTSGSGRPRAAWSMMDQFVSSGTNFLMLFMVIRTSTITEVGAFTIAYTAFFLILAIVRGLAIEPLVVRYSGVDLDRWRPAAASAVGLALTMAIIIGLLVGVPATAFGGRVGTALATMTVVLPLLLVQDAWRLAFFSLGRPGAACVNDVIFLFSQVAGYLAIHEFSQLRVGTLIVGWGVASGVAGLCGIWQAHVVPRPTQSLAWLRSHKDLGPAFAADYLANRGAEQIAMVATSYFGGLAALGAISAIRSLFSPLTTVQTGLNSFALPEVSALWRSRQTRRVIKLVWTLTGAMSLLMLVAGVALAFLPNHFGVSLFHANWEPARRLLFPMTVFSVANAAGYGLWIGLRGMQMAKQTLYARASFGILLVLATGVGASYAGAAGAIWGMTLGAVGLGVRMAFLVRRQTLRPEYSNRKEDVRQW